MLDIWFQNALTQFATFVFLLDTGSLFSYQPLSLLSQDMLSILLWKGAAMGVAYVVLSVFSFLLFKVGVGVLSDSSTSEPGTLVLSLFGTLLVSVLCVWAAIKAWAYFDVFLSLLYGPKAVVIDMLFTFPQ